MPDNLSADERAAVEKVERILDKLSRSAVSRLPGGDEVCTVNRESITLADLRTLLAVVARAGEAVADASKQKIAEWATVQRAVQDRVTKHYDSVVLKREREAASTAWDAARDMWIARDTHIEFKGLAELKRKEFDEARDRYLAREYHAPAPEGVTLSDGSVVTYNAATRIITRRLDHPQTTHDSLASYWERPVSQWYELMMHTHTGADFDALKAFAERAK